MKHNHLTIIRMKAYNRKVTDFTLTEKPMSKEDVADFVFKKCATGYPLKSEHYDIVGKKTIKHNHEKE